MRSQEKEPTDVHHNDGGNKSVNTQNTSHNDRQHILHDSIRSEDTHRAYTHSSLSRSVGRAEV